MKPNSIGVTSPADCITSAAQTARTAREEYHDRTFTPQRAHGRCRRNRDGTRPTRRRFDGARRGASGGQAGRSCLSLQGRFLRDHGPERWLAGLSRTDAMVRNAKADEINAALEAAYLPKGTFRSVYHPIVVNTGSKLVLIDTGNSTVRGPSMGHLPASMAAAGIDAKSIDVVLISHFHPDHINGILAPDGKSLQYPNAEIMVPAAEWAFWMDEAAMNRLPDGGIKNNHKNCFRVFAGLENKVTKYGWDKEVAPGITAFASIGHTPGHTSYIVTSGNGRVLVQSDVTQRPELYVRNPHWQAGGDMDGPKAAETRRKLYDMAVAEKMLVRVPLPVPGRWLRGEGRQRLSAGPDRLESDFKVPFEMAQKRRRAARVASERTRRSGVAPYRAAPFCCQL